ncbi:MAG: ATPase, T2SS/T4P/T4SS family [Pseudomonadota bacterium]
MEWFEHPLLAALPRTVRSKIPLAAASFETGDVVHASGQGVDRVHFVLQGAIHLLHKDQLLGVKSVVEIAGPGHLVGAQTDLGSAAVARHEAVAVEPVRTASLGQEAFQALLQESPSFAMAFIRYNELRRELVEERAIATGRINIESVRVDNDLVRRVTLSYVLSHRVIPVALKSGTATVAIVDADLTKIEHDMKRLLGAARVVPLKISQKQFDDFQRRHLGPDLATPSSENESSWYREVRDKNYAVHYENPYESLLEHTKGKDLEIDGAAVVRLSDKIIGEALDLDASDIHFEPFPDGIGVRFRMDGELVARPETVRRDHLAAMLSRLKVLAGMDIAERRKPQDGRATAVCNNRKVDLRISTVPTRFGEKIVIRILDPVARLMDLDSLVVSQEVLDSILWMVERPYGMILVCGPTGSGKTTTIYSLLMRKKEQPVNIVTIEDPIEYILEGITQVQRNPAVGLDFPHAVRAFLRQDPDVILVGETRDPETAKASLEAGLTGHLVLTTIHAGNVFASLYRLSEMGIDPFIIANSVVGLISQRLVRRVCSTCADNAPYHRRLIEPLGLPGLARPDGDFYMFRRGRGCAACNDKGYKGRMAVFETLRVVDDFKHLLAENRPFAETRVAARKLGIYQSMRQYSALLLGAGLTTPEEISRILFYERGEDLPDASRDAPTEDRT